MIVGTLVKEIGYLFVGVLCNDAYIKSTITSIVNTGI